MLQSFVSTAPTYGDSRAKVQGKYFLIVTQCRRHAGFITLGHLARLGSLLCWAGQRAGLLPSACPHRAGLIPGL